MSAEGSHLFSRSVNGSDPGGTARIVEVPEAAPPRSGIGGAADGPMTSPRVGLVNGERRCGFDFCGMKRGPNEGTILRTDEGFVCPIYYDEAAIDRIARKAPQLLPQLLAELARNQR